MPLIQITEADYDVVLDLRYATTDNLTGKPVYRHPVCYLHPDAEKCLRKAIALAAPHGLRLKIFDAYRPPEAQWIFWNHTPDPIFLADPRKGSPHSRGAAIDLTLIDKDGIELDMGTGFDAFTDLSHHGRTDVSLEAQKNRFLLLGIMSAAGFDFYSMEWWHYQLFNARSYPLISDTALPLRIME
jgi:D-alanyl-D-alanine dipeptidase